MEEKKKTWDRYKIPDSQRGHRPKSFPGEDMVIVSIYIPIRLKEGLKRIGNKRLAEWIEGHELCQCSD